MAFYCWGEPELVWVFLLSIGLNHVFGLVAEQTRESAAGRWTIGLTVVVNIGLLAYFKYANFFVDSTNTLLTAAGFSVQTCARSHCRSASRFTRSKQCRT
ncbi:MAG: hypothetical protein QM775_02440 [Pirellulales bacterium]